ncbi:MAG: transcription termination/antitermination protein NusG [Clostridia bacterium]|nr:transcription termination/antitermination protein NusG [Clostridia bacterium]
MADENRTADYGEDSRIDWFVVHTYSGYEKKVHDDILTKAQNDPNVNGKILDAIVPTVTVKETVEVKPPKSEENEDDPKPRKKVYRVKETEKKLYPGYVMVKVKTYYDLKKREYKMTDETWYVIRNTRGVTGFLGPESKPLPLTAAEVEQLGVAREEEKNAVAVGDYVEITDELFAGSAGVVSEIDAQNGLVTVMISMFGQQTPTQISINSVRKLDD